jgi:hypothetical protein
MKCDEGCEYEANAKDSDPSCLTHINIVLCQLNQPESCGDVATNDQPPPMSDNKEKRCYRFEHLIMLPRLPSASNFETAKKVRMK